MPDGKQMWSGREGKGSGGSQEMAATEVRAQGEEEIKQPLSTTGAGVGEGFGGTPSPSSQLFKSS